MKTKQSILKRSLTVFLFLGLSITLLAGGGPSFRELHSLKLPFKPTNFMYAHTGDFRFFLCSSKTDMLMFDGATGKISWKINFKTDFANQKFEYQLWNKEANVVLLYNEDSKKGIAEKYFLDGKTGKLLWKSDKYVSDFGKYELSEGFENYFDAETNGVLLPSRDNVDFVDVYSGKVIWSKNFELTGKAKQFDCYIMNYYNLVKIITGKEESIYLTTREGTEVTETDPYFNQKKYMADRKHATMIGIPDKNMYIIMQGETNRVFEILGALSGQPTDVPKWKMNFVAYEEGTNRELWRKKYTIGYVFDWIDNTPMVRMNYADGKLFVTHDPALKTNDGLTVLDVNTGEKLWTAYYSSSEMKNGLSKTTLTPFPAPLPVVSEGKAYVVDKVKNTVRCYDAQNGTLIWETKKYPDAQKIPALLVTNGVVMLAYGSPASKIVREEVKTGNSTRTVYKRMFLDKDKYGLIAYDAKTGAEIWNGDQAGKKAKDNFSYLAGVEYIDGKLYCATDENFFILDPPTGNVIKSIPVSKEKLGKAWKLIYFPQNQKMILNCNKGIIKIDAVTAAIEGTLKTPNVSAYPASVHMNADNDYADYAIFTDGNSEKLDFKTFASIDLDKMTVRGTGDAALLFYDNPHFSEGAEMFYQSDGSEISIFSIE